MDISALKHICCTVVFGLYRIFARDLLREDENCDTKDFRIELLASVIPIGTFYIDRK